MSDDLKALRQAVEALGRRKTILSAAGRNRLAVLAGNLKTYEKMREGVLERRDEPVFALVRKLLLQDIAELEDELRNSDTA